MTGPSYQRKYIGERQITSAEAARQFCAIHPTLVPLGRRVGFAERSFAVIAVIAVFRVIRRVTEAKADTGPSNIGVRCPNQPIQLSLQHPLCRHPLRYGDSSPERLPMRFLVIQVRHQTAGSQRFTSQADGIS